MLSRGTLLSEGLQKSGTSSRSRVRPEASSMSWGTPQPDALMTPVIPCCLRKSICACVTSNTCGPLGRGHS